MDNPDESFHHIALRSILFKGRADWYFCYLKSEKIAHVLNLLASSSSFKTFEGMEELVAAANRLPHMITHFVAGEVEAGLVLADIFSLLSMLRLAATQGIIRSENSAILVREYEEIIRRIAAQDHPSPFITSQDFLVEAPEIPAHPQPLSVAGASGLLARSERKPIKDNNKGHIKDTAQPSQGQHERTAKIYEIVKNNNGVSIKDIAKVVKGCSEKTIQRELAGLIKQGLVEKRGEKRWSVYIPTSLL
ncbi:MAG TPA: hypothetical protein VG753_03600 [Candidatus Paceibacterota bacterium]|nr:hypothetical protein [Candidatus Paceibacterota bacterium]